MFLSLGPLPGRIFETDGYGQLVAPRFKVLTKKPLETTVETAVFRYEGGEVEVKLEQGVPWLEVSPQLVGAKGTLELAEGRKPWLLSL